MTLQGAINELNNLYDSEDIPFYYKPTIKKIIETIEQEISTPYYQPNHKFDMRYVERAIKECDT